MARCYPAPDEWDALRVSLTEGERYLAETLTEVLSGDWRVYLQPHVAGARPDLVLVHPRAGVQFIEVKDYDLGAYDYSGDGWAVRTGGGDWQAIGDPFTQVDRARKLFFQIMLPFAGQHMAGTDGTLYGFTRASVFLTRASRADVLDVKQYLARTRDSNQRYYGVGGRAGLEAGDGPGKALRDLIPLVKREESGNPHADTVAEAAEEIGLDKPWHEVLHGWFYPTPEEHAQNQPLELTDAQRDAAWSRARHLLVRGPAGSGKSLVMARRVAHALIRSDAPVLVLSFNITLWHYLHDFIARGVRTALLEGRQYTAAEQREMGKAAFQRAIRDELPEHFKRAMRSLTLSHFHGFAGRLFDAVDAETPHPSETGQALQDHADELRARTSGPDALETYGALFIDEAQDWTGGWVRGLRPVLQDGAGVTIAADAGQRLYEHATSDVRGFFAKAAADDDAPDPSAFMLEGTARVPEALLPAINSFRAAYAPEETPAEPLAVAPQLQMDFEGRPDPDAAWTTVAPEGRSGDALTEALAAQTAQRVQRRTLDGINPSQIACLVDTHAHGLALGAALEALGLPSVSVCVEDPDGNRSRKHAFWRLDARLKISTIHSFKGWEADVVVVMLPPEEIASQHSTEALYVALTRSRAVLECVAPAGGFYRCPGTGWEKKEAARPAEPAAATA